jgi:hypothetical protein
MNNDHIHKQNSLGQFLKIGCGLAMDNNVTFVTFKIHYKNVFMESSNIVSYPP